MRSQLAASAFIAALIALTLAFPGTASAAPERLLTINLAGEGEGEVECRVGTGPASPCEEEETYADQTKLTLIPVAEEGSRFAGFSAGTGSAAGCVGTGSCTFTISSDSSVTATFEQVPEFTLSVELAGEGEGEVECKVGGELEFCQDEYPSGTAVTLIPVVEEGSRFAGFSAGTGSAAGCSGKTGSCTVVIATDSAVTATFDYKEYALKVVRKGTGSGTWVCEREEGPEPCAAKYRYGSEVIVRATPSTGSELTGWEGDCHKILGGGGECEVEMYGARTVSPIFAAIVSGKEPPPEEEPPVEESPSERPPPSDPGAAAVPSVVAPGTARAAGLARVSGHTAALRLACAGGPCAGSITLTAKLERGGKTRSVAIGRASFDLAPGASIVLRAKLSTAAVKQLERGGGLKAEATGPGIARSTVELSFTRKRQIVHQENTGH